MWMRVVYCWLMVQCYAAQLHAETTSLAKPSTGAPSALPMTSAPSTGDSLGRMVLGTLVVLLVIAAIAWLVKRILPGHGLTQRGVISQVGGLALGPRERVVVLEVAGRWLVVGIQPGQMTALGEVTPPAPVAEDETLAAAMKPTEATSVDASAPFAQRLQQAMQTTLQNAVSSRLKSRKNAP